MIIEKILNNNVVITVDPKTRKEKILMGSGLAFKKKIGQEIDQDKIEKIFVTGNQDESNQFIKLIEEIPMEIIQITDDIVKYSESKLNRVLDKHIYVALADHIAFALKRLNSKIILKNNLLEEIKRVHREEFDAARWAVNFINEHLSVELPIDEAGFIALHIVNASYTESIKESYLLTNVVRDILNIIRYHFSVEFIDDDLNYDRLLTHLKFFAKRVISNNQHPNNEDIFIDIVKNKYKSAYECAEKIRSYIHSKYKYNVSDAELVYLSMHIQRVITVIKDKKK